MNAISALTAATREFFQNPDSVGSAFPATSHMVRRTLDPIDWSQIDVFVEFGPGTGRFTFEALARMKAGTKLLAIEPGVAFVEHLQTSVDDERLIVVRGAAQEIRDILKSHGVQQADCILSGLPFSTIDRADAMKIAEYSRLSLASNGLFVAYQMRRHIERYLLGRFEIERKGLALWNIPPCHIYWAKPLHDQRAGVAPSPAPSD